MTRMFDHRLHNRPLPSTPSHTTYITYTTAHSQAPPHIPHTSHTQPPTPKHPPHRGIPHPSHTHTAFKLVLKLRLPPGTQKERDPRAFCPPMESQETKNPRRTARSLPPVSNLYLECTTSNSFTRARCESALRERAARARYESALRERATRARCESALRERVCAAESMTRHIMA
jgi:hypothetical protein